MKRVKIKNSKNSKISENWFLSGVGGLYSVLDPDFLRKLEQGCYSHVSAVWDRYEFEHCRKLTSWKRRTGFLVSSLQNFQKMKVFSNFPKFGNLPKFECFLKKWIKHFSEIEMFECFEFLEFWKISKLVSFKKSSDWSSLKNDEQMPQKDKTMETIKKLTPVHT